MEKSRGEPEVVCGGGYEKVGGVGEVKLEKCRKDLDNKTGRRET